MSLNSIVRKTLNLCDHKVVEVEYIGRSLIIHLDRKMNRNLPCSICGKRSAPRDHLKKRTWKHVPLWGISVIITYFPVRVSCVDCGIHVEKIPWTIGKSRQTTALMIVLATFARILAWDQIKKHFHVSWGTVHNAVKSVVQYGLEHRNLSDVRRLGIDELSRKKGHVYLTNVYDLDKKTLLWSGEDRKSDTLDTFFDDMGDDFEKHINAVCCDMWDPYIKTLTKRIPNAIMVFDKFHIIRHLLDAVDRTRKAELKTWENKDENPLKMTKYIWLKRPENLTSKQKDTLQFLMKMNLKIIKAYLLKERFMEFWKCRTYEKGKIFLNTWFWWATHSRIKPMRDFAWMLRRHEDNILSWFLVPIDNGATEAMNNNAKEISHRSRGFRFAKTFALSMMHCLGGLQMPQTTHTFV